jgi:branched-chain amino acid aminotransferase
LNQLPDLQAIRLWKLSLPGEVEEQVLPESKSSSLDQISGALPQGVYTSFRTYHRFQALHMGDHFKRLAGGATRLGRPVTIRPEAIRRALRAILSGLENRDHRVRLSVDLEQKAGELYILIEELHVPSPESYANGVKTLARPFQRLTPEAKYTRFILDSNPYRGLVSKEVNEVLLYNPQEQILEGLSSNFFAVMDGAVHTAETGVLPGITRSIVLDEARGAGIKLVFEPVNLNAVGQINEAFLTSASRAVLPVRRIENQSIGTGGPGALTRRLGELYNRRVFSELEDI